MRCSKFIFSIFFTICCLSSNALATNWVVADNNGKRIFIDTDSINVNMSSIYYNVRYYEKAVGEDVVATIQAKDNYAGLVSTCKYSEYLNNPKLANSYTKSIAKTFNELTPNSLLYNANLIANDSKNYLVKKNSNVKEQKLVNTNKQDLVDFRPYMKNLQEQIKKNWNPPKGNESKQVILLFKIAKDGSLLSCSVYKSSGLQSADQAAMNAVNLTAPFEPLPDKYTEEEISIQFTFDYNVFGKSKNK